MTTSGRKSSTDRLRIRTIERPTTVGARLLRETVQAVFAIEAPGVQGASLWDTRSGTLVEEARLRRAELAGAWKWSRASDHDVVRSS